MNIFAGNITLVGNKKIDLEFDTIENLSKTGDKTIFIFGETELETSEKLLAFFKEKLGELKSYDLSISTEDKIEMVGESYSEGIYELASFQGEEVSFEEIKERFMGFDEAVIIREAEISEKFGNRIVKVDFVY